MPISPEGRRRSTRRVQHGPGPTAAPADSPTRPGSDRRRGGDSAPSQRTAGACDPRTIKTMRAATGPGTGR